MFPPLLFYSQCADFVEVCHTVSHHITHFYQTAVMDRGLCSAFVMFVCVFNLHFLSTSGCRGCD